MGKQLTLIVVPHDNAKMRNYRFSYRAIYFVTTLVVLSFACIVFLLVTYGEVLLKSSYAGKLARENVRLSANSAQIDSLRAELIRAQTMGIQIKRMLGVGLSLEDSLLVANLSPIVKSPAILNEPNLEQVAREEQKELLKAIPSLWPVKGYVTREFHTTGGEKSSEYHPGMDIAGRRNTSVRSSAEGVVVTSQWDPTYGFMVVVDHGFGIYSLYGHNERNLAKVGDRVARGQTIAFLGSTGKSTAPHLHFEIRKNGVPVNPREFLLN